MDTVMTKPMCPSCGDNEIQQILEEYSCSVPFGPTVQRKVKHWKCESCGYEGDLNNEGEEARIALLQESKTRSVAMMLDALVQRGITNAYFERSLGLPVRSVARWKKGEFTSSALALLRLVSTYPWLLDVANKDYSKQEANERLFVAASLMIESVCKELASASSAASQTVDVFIIHVVVAPPKPVITKPRLVDSFPYSLGCDSEPIRKHADAAN